MKKILYFFLMTILIFQLSVISAGALNDTIQHGGSGGGGGSSSTRNKDSKGITINTSPVAPEVVYPEKTFVDIEDDKNKIAIEALAQRGIINGVPGDLFLPENKVTRGEFAVILSKALSLSGGNQSTFDDVEYSDWFCPYVNAVYGKGIVSGVSATSFNPHGTITRQEAANMVANAIKLCGTDTYISEGRVEGVLSAYADKDTVSNWAKNNVAYCIACNILDLPDGKIDATKEVTRSEIAQIVYDMLILTKLI